MASRIPGMSRATVRGSRSGSRLVGILRPLAVQRCKGDCLTPFKAEPPSLSKRPANLVSSVQALVAKLPRCQPERPLLLRPNILPLVSQTIEARTIPPLLPALDTCSPDGL